MPQPWAYRRCDFIVHRVDGSHVRLHPSQKREAFVVIGVLDDWITRAPAPGNTRGIDRQDGGTFRQHSQIDIVGQNDARFIVDEILRDSSVNGEVDITQDGRFSWKRFFMGRQWGQELLDTGVARVYANRDRHGMVYCRVVAGNHPREGLITWTISGNGKFKAKFSWAGPVRPRQAEHVE